MKIKIFLNILILIGLVYLFSCTNGNRKTYNDNNVTNASYSINHYIDTINEHIVLTTVCDDRNSNNVSVSTIELKY